MLDSPDPDPELPAEPPQRQRKVIHIDMDAFYASVKQRDEPALRGKPVAVGSSRERGVVAASYEARRFGVRSAMWSTVARRKCPELVFVQPRFDVYREVSLQVRGILAEHTPAIEFLSLDEAYLDVTENLQGILTATQIAREIRGQQPRAGRPDCLGRGVLQQRMARPVCKQFNGNLGSLRQRIRSQGRTLAKMEIRAFWSS